MCFSLEWISVLLPKVYCGSSFRYKTVYAYAPKPLGDRDYADIARTKTETTGL
jgi:hypothetical protein